MGGLQSRANGVIVHSSEQAQLARSLTERPVVLEGMAPILIARSRGSDTRDVVYERLLFGMVRPCKGLEVTARTTSGTGTATVLADYDLAS
jgi:hypothetical protein